jgi:hypothetical protein
MLNDKAPQVATIPVERAAEFPADLQRAAGQCGPGQRVQVAIYEGGKS